MNKINVSTVDKGLLVIVVSNLEEVEISETQLTVQQLEAIITAIGAGDCLVKRLDISRNNLSTVCHSLLASALKMIEEVNLSGTDLTVQQMEAIMTAIVDGDCLVKSLTVSSNKLSTVNPGLMALADRLRVEKENAPGVRFKPQFGRVRCAVGVAEEKNIQE